MPHFKSISISGVLVGFVVIVATSIVLSILSPFIFSNLLKTGDWNVLITSAGPLSYALTVLFIASVFGVFICNKVASNNELINAILVVALYIAFTYWLSTSPSNMDKPYPQWFKVMSYLILAPGAIVGHYLSIKLNKNV